VPEGGITYVPHEEVLTYEEILRIVRVAVKGGIRKVRLTGGEPLVRKGLMGFVRRLREIDDLEQIAVTTNGVLLADYAKELRNYGVKRINVSLDSLNPEKFAKITRRDLFHKVWEGLEFAEKVGYSPIKINVVAMRGVNDDEIFDFARLSLEKPYHIRFIEFMPIGTNNRWSDSRFISSAEIRERLTRMGPLRPLEHRLLDGPAERFVLEGSKGELGFIGAISHHFCSKCNRLRLTSEGALRGCLFSDKEIDVKTPLRSQASDEHIMELIHKAIKSKPVHHGPLSDKQNGCSRPMSSIGG
jgi:cyclic pyranopterin phosphate synthase